MNAEKRMADQYEIKHAIHIGDKEVVFGEHTGLEAELPFMVANYTYCDFFAQYTEVVGSKDYLNIMEEFIARVKQQLHLVKEAKQQVSVSQEPLTIRHCYPNNSAKDIINQLVAIKASSLRQEHRCADKQLVLVTGGFGSYGNSRGRAVFTKNIYHGHEARWNREDIMGIVKEDCLPAWAAEKLQQMNAATEGHTDEPELTM